MAHVGGSLLEMKSEAAGHAQVHLARTRQSNDRQLQVPVEPRVIAMRRRRRSMLQYQSDLKQYHDEMEAWTIDRKESMAARQVEHEEIESTMIDLIRVFVSENGKVPTDDQIQEILKSTSHAILKSEHLIDSDASDSSGDDSDDDSDDDALSSPPPPSLPERPIGINAADLNAIEDVYLGHQPEAHLELDGDHDGLNVPRVLATKINRSVVSNWKKLRIIHKWARKGANIAQVQAMEAREQEQQEQTVKARREDKAQAMWARARLHISAFHAANHLNRTLRQKRQAQLERDQKMAKDAADRAAAHQKAIEMEAARI